MTISLKAHWIDTLTRIADAGNDGIRGTDVDRRSAAALEHRGLVISFEKRFYSGLDDVPGMSTWYRLTDAGTIWLIKHENPTPSSRALPAGWTMVEAGYCLHTASRIEVRRDGRKWGVLRPLTADPTADWMTTMYSVVDVKPTRAAALAAAAKAIPAALQLIADATFEAVGRPETWPAGQADEGTVHARHDAVYASQTRTGYQAEPDERVIHVELGTRGTYAHGEGDCSYVLFDGEGGSDLVHSGDVVVITEPRPVGTFAVTREPKYADWTDLGGPDTPGEDYYLLVDGQRVGGTYWCSDDSIPAGQKWASWGAAGYSFRHPTREAAEAVQVREYATNPDLCDRLNADYKREQCAERERRAAEEQARIAELDAARRIEREGDDGPGETVWTLPAYHFLIAADLADVTAVKAWLDAHDLDGVSGVHEIRIEQRLTRRVIVVERARHGWMKQTETWAVTCHTDPPAVDTTARPDLVELITSRAHYPARFPLIDFGQDWACGPCTKELGSGTGMVLWECEAFRKAREAGAAKLALAQAERDAITAEAALRVAAVADRDTTPESNRLRDAEINYTRRRLAVDVLTRDPDMRLLMVSVSGDDGSTWTPLRWMGVVAVPGETAAEQAERYAVTRHLIEPPPSPKADPWGLLDNPRPLRVEVFADPMDTEPAGVWTNLTVPCPPGGHDPGPNPVTGGPAVQTGCCARCLHRVWRRPGGSWLLEGEPLPGPSPSPSPGGNPDPDPDPHEKIINSGSPSSGPGPGPGPDAPPSFGWRIETRTGRRHWRSVRTGNSPALFYSDPVVLWGAADTILGNARQVLGLGPAEPMPAVRVRTWDRQTGLVRFAATRNRKVNQRA